MLDILFMVNDTISCRAAWVLEFMCDKQLEALFPYLDYFTQNIHRVHLDPAVRPVAKVCEHLALAYYPKESPENHRGIIKRDLKSEHIKRIVAFCFDCMIEDEKVAPKAYSMQTLFLFGQDNDWIHPELKLIIERDYPKQSAAFKARARHILKKINDWRFAN